MVGLHFFQLKMLFAFWANAFLPFVCSASHFGTKCSNAKMLFVAVKKILIDTFLISDIFIVEQFNNMRFKCFGVVSVRAILVIVNTPLKAAH